MRGLKDAARRATRVAHRPWVRSKMQMQRSRYCVSRRPHVWHEKAGVGTEAKTLSILAHKLLRPVGTAVRLKRLPFRRQGRTPAQKAQITRQKDPRTQGFLRTC
jgi:hypothetical protein